MILELKVRLADDEILNSVSTVVFNDPAILDPSVYQVNTQAVLPPDEEGEKKTDITIAKQPGAVSLITELKVSADDDLTLAMIGASVFGDSATLDPAIYEVFSSAVTGTTEKQIDYVVKPKP